jgi:hypothetical protein
MSPPGEGPDTSPPGSGPAMREIQRIDLETARGLIQFDARQSVSRDLAEQQLRGAVALHNILADTGFAYLADEVGLGKTYVALGVVGLLRHYHPDLRVLYIAPRENLQKKWRKEIYNFTAYNWKIADRRVKTLQDTPAAEVCLTDNLAGLVHAACINDRRDFLIRMTSLSLPLSREGAADSWRAKRRELLRELPWLSSYDFNLRSKDKESFKEAYAMAVNAALPRFDLVVIDEGHNFKHGLDPARASTRNRLLSLVLGTRDDVQYLNGGGRKLDRVLFLSATPLEGEYRELWNQLHLLGFGHDVGELAERDGDPVRQKALARQFLIRRLTELELGGERYTKNMYRREWRAGGMQHVHQPMVLSDDRKRLVVALVQKKVTEVMAAMGREQKRRFGRHFQMGMLASFESFFQTARVRSTDDEGVFDQGDQTDHAAEKEGIDTPTINALISSYEETFKEPLPHPKMDAVAADLQRALESGDKTLVFVRRTATVDELKHKLCHAYDRWLHAYLRAGLPPGLQTVLDLEVEEYRRKQAWYRRRHRPLSELEAQQGRDQDDTQEDSTGFGTKADKGGLDTFYAWFFRGTARKDLLTGATFRKNRLDSEGSVYATLLEDNHVAWLLGQPAQVLRALSQATGITSHALQDQLTRLAFGWVKSIKVKRVARLKAYKATVDAGLQLLAEYAGGELRRKAGQVLQSLHHGRRARPADTVPDNFPDAAELIETRTVFTELRARPDLCDVIWPEPNTFPSSSASFRETFLQRERQRELLASVISLGHPCIDLWLLAVGQIGTLAVGEGRMDAVQVTDLAGRFLDRIQDQSGQPGLTSYRELGAIGRNADLIWDTNFPEIREKELHQLRTYYGNSLGSQTPVGGMHGGVNARLVKQFRMPGYPYVLISTDVLQEGEDLHTFASRVVHYGISWTPSAMEQRTGRLDRIGCQTHRRLRQRQQVAGDRCLQVYYPFLPDTVEQLQIREIYKRMNRFIQMLHEDLTFDEPTSSTLDVTDRLLEKWEEVLPPEGKLTSAFQVPQKALQGNRRPPAVSPEDQQKISSFFDSLKPRIAAAIHVDWEIDPRPYLHTGTVWIHQGSLLPCRRNNHGCRQQPFTLFLRSTSEGHLLLRVVSPVGEIPTEDSEAIWTALEIQRQHTGAKLCATKDHRRSTYKLTAVTDILFGLNTTQIEEVLQALEAATLLADDVELNVFGEETDRPLDDFRDTLTRETQDENKHEEN